MSENDRISFEEAKIVAEEILMQLGGMRFVAFTGATFFLALRVPRGGLQFKLPSDPGYVKMGINTVRIVANGSDLYDVQYGQARGTAYEVLKESKDLYADMLENDFTEATGLFTRL